MGVAHLPQLPASAHKGELSDVSADSGRQVLSGDPLRSRHLNDLHARHTKIAELFTQTCPDHVR